MIATSFRKLTNNCAYGIYRDLYQQYLHYTEGSYLHL